MDSELPFTLSTRDLPRYLVDIKWGHTPEEFKVHELKGGVSNRAFWVDSPAGPFVVKQARPQLAVKMEWLADVNRIIREAMALQYLQQRIGRPHIPQLLHLDRENKVLLMEAITPEATNYKDLLLRGEIDPSHADQFGSLLARIHNASCDMGTQEAFEDASYFEQLRLSPYYDTVAERYPALAPRLQELREECLTKGHCLVHGDYSPKNVLVLNGELILLDYEVAHWGNPSFDVGFALTHYLAKAIHMPQHAHLLLAAARVFWQSYNKRIGLQYTALDNAGHHLAAILLARVVGKSPLEYLTDKRKQESIIHLATGALEESVVKVEHIFTVVESTIKSSR